MLPATTATTRPPVQPVFSASAGGAAGGREPVPGGFSVMKASHPPSPLHTRRLRRYVHIADASTLRGIATSGASPSWLRSRNRPQPRWPRHRFLSGVGLDDQA